MGAGLRRGLVIALVAGLTLLVGAGGAVFANTALSSKYSHGQATLDYFIAQQHADATGMEAVATFLRSDAAFNGLFDHAAITAMLRTSQNTDLKDVKVLSVQSVNANTSKVSVAMTWAGHSRTATYTLRREKSQGHYLFYNTWRIDIPYTTISVDLPNQPGPVYVDGLVLPAGVTPKRIEAIAGYHTLRMAANAFYDQSVRVANGVDADASVTLDGTISAATNIAAAGAIKDTLNNFCDAAKFDDCPGHTYTAPNDGYIYYLTMPGYLEIDYKSYVFTLSTDPTADMKLVVTTESGKMTSTGTCATLLTVDGSRKYSFTGTWKATLLWNGSSFAGTNVTYDCAAAKA